jgi:hypothetical protein
MYPPAPIISVVFLIVNAVSVCLVFKLIDVICAESAARLGRKANSLLALQASRSQHLL